ncbi:MAG: copper chaperone PCu(A)C [Lysobacteraceae bacterium]
MNAFAYRLAAAVLFALVLPAPVAARDCRPQVREGWVRMPPSGMSMMAGFGRIVNRCSTPTTILSARSPSFASVELHETRVIDGVSKMRPVPTLRIAPDGAAILRPGGMHLMLMRPGSTLKAGSRIVVEFELAGGGTLLGEFEVRKPEL